MKCISCGSRTLTVSSRPSDDGASTWRRRQCRTCGKRFSTREEARTEGLFVSKRSGRRERFVYEKLFASVFTQLNTRKHRDNGSDARNAKAITRTVILGLVPRFVRDGAVPTRSIVLLTHAELAKFDPSAAAGYIHYSEYRLKVAKRSPNTNG